MRTYDLSPLYRTAIGFDRLARLLNDVQRNETETAYPPYNIELISDNEYRIVMAVAGFEMSELEIETEHQALKVVGKQKKQEEKTTFLHRGIAARDFEHKFQLADHVKVTHAKLMNGLLHIDLVREVPEALKPRKVEIEVSNADRALLEQKAA
ncbi:MAG: heat-shock protein [Methylophilaceae bacterium 17-44-8]|jgi:molecular chaperone IbpA|nr:MAG: heat-shock protein [Methylophilales bacterium 28-44-11]OZA05535.1 MAG: heat-shock protein [Methylophilaceae bacterium 17-44-8]